MKYTCEECYKEVDDNGPYEVMYFNHDEKYCCQDCYEKACAIGDMEYERQREEGLI